MKLTIKKQVEQVTETDIYLPAFFALYGNQVMIREDGTIIKAHPSFGYIMPKDRLGYERDLSEILSIATPSTEEKFRTTLAQFVETIESAVVSEPANA